MSQETFTLPARAPVHSLWRWPYLLSWRICHLAKYRFWNVRRVTFMKGSKAGEVAPVTETSKWGVGMWVPLTKELITQVKMSDMHSGKQKAQVT